MNRPLVRLLFSALFGFIVSSCSHSKVEIQWKKNKEGILFFQGEEKIGCLKKFNLSGIISKDYITELDSGIYLIRRDYTNITDSVKNPQLVFDFIRYESPVYYMIPAVNYNGNKWGNGDNDNKNNPGSKFLSYSYRRTSIPAMTYSEGKYYSVGIWCDSIDYNTGISCAFIKKENQCIHRLLIPEEEQPLSYNNRNVYTKGWIHPMKLMAHETYSLFSIISIIKTYEKHKSVHKMLSFAWSRYKKLTPEKFDCAKLWKLSCLFAKESLWVQTKKYEGFSIGLWKENGRFVQRPVSRYEIGWSGQNASLANSLLKNYLISGDIESLNKGIKTLDTWASAAALDNGLFITHFDDILLNRKKEAVMDASNLSTAAFQYLEAALLVEKCGLSKPIYRQIGLNICNFILGNQETSGRYGRLWNISGECFERDGTVGASLIPAMIKAFQTNGQNAYFESALKAYDFYTGDFIQDGFTTAGALDAKCIDKESAVPLLRSSILLYEITKNKEYLSNAEELSGYLSTWLWHYSARFPEDSDLNHYQYDTFASTAVSTLYHHLSPFGLNFVQDWLKLSEYTGNPIWKEKAIAVWHNANQLVSDNKLIIHGLKLPVGSQSEACFHTYWQNFGEINDWYVAWPCAFRMEVLRNMNDWNILSQ